MKRIAIIVLLLLAGGRSVRGQGTVLEFTSSAHHHVNHGQFWQPGVDLPRTFYWDGWVAPTADGGYVISEGYGGLHSLLFGFGGVAATSYNPLTGNVWDGATTLSFGGDDGPIPGEWCHIAVASDGQRIVTYMNGVPVGVVLYTQQHRYAQQGTLFVMGSGHANAGGRLAALRGFEGFNPLAGTFDAANRMLVAFRPSVRLEAYAARRGYSNAPVAASFLADYTVPATVIADHSPAGYNGAHHPGNLWGTGIGGDSSINDGFGKNVMASLYPLPKWVQDAAAPTAQFDAAPSVPASAPLAPLAAPSGALIFDSLNRPDSTFAFEGSPTLGSTESGSLGPRAWQYNAPVVSDGKGDGAFRWGVFKGRAVALGGPGFQVAFVDAATANQDVRVDRRGYPAAYSDGRTGLSFRVQDGDNFWYAASDGTRPDQQTIRWGYYQAKTRVSLSSAAAPATWTTLRAVANGTTITIYCDATQIATLSNSQFASATKAGLFMDDFGNGHSGVARFDNFTVLSSGGAPPPPPPPPPTGAVVRLRADEITGVGNGAALSAWTDALGNSAAQSDATKRPLYQSTPLVHFDGVDDRLDIASLNWPQEFTVFVVCSRPATTPAQVLASNAGKQIFGIVIGQDFANQVSFMAYDTANNGFRANHGGANPAQMILTLRRSATAIQGWVNGASDGPVTTIGTPQSGANPLIIGEIGYDFWRYGGDVREVVVYFSALTDGARLAEETTLGQRWSIP